MSADDFHPLSPLELRRSSDEELVAHAQAALAAGHELAHERALEQLIGRYAAALLAWDLKVPESLQEDMANDILLAAVRAIDAGKEIGNFRAWLSKVARNHAAAFHRGKQGRQLKLDREAATRETVDDHGQPLPAPEGVDLGEYGEAELWMLVDDVLCGLNDRHRTVIDLYVFDAMNAKEVADATGESQDNVFKVAQRFRDQLRERLEQAERGGDTGGIS